MNKQESFMRRIGIVLLATAGIAIATPAFAQGLYLGAGPGGIGIGVGGAGYDSGYYNNGYSPEYGYRQNQDYGYRQSGYQNYEGSYAYAPEYRQCRTSTIRTPNGNLRRVRRCY